MATPSLLLLRRTIPMPAGAPQALLPRHMITQATVRSCQWKSEKMRLCSGPAARALAGRVSGPAQKGVGLVKPPLRSADNCLRDLMKHLYTTVFLCLMSFLVQG